MMDSKQVEQMCVDKGLDAPRVTRDQIEALKATITVKVQRVEGTNVMVAVALLPDGFMVGYGFSACVSGTNFDEEIGRGVSTRNAMADAEKTLWAFEGYLLRHTIANTPRPLGEVLREGE